MLSQEEVAIEYVKFIYQNGDDHKIKRGDDGAISGFTGGHLLSVATDGKGFEDSGIKKDTSGATADKVVTLKSLHTDNRVITLPDATDTLIGKNTTDILTLKTLTTPVIASFYRDAGKTKLMTVPNVASDTLALLAAVQILTNKRLNSPKINEDTILSSASSAIDDAVDKKHAKPDANYDFSAGSWDYPDSNPAPLDTDSGTNGTAKRILFDDTTEEFIIDQIKLPGDLNALGTVTFETYGHAVTSVADKKVQLKFYHCAKAAGESWDAAFASKVSGDKDCDSTQDEKGLDHFTWTETIANLGWAANDFVRIKLSRIAPSENNLSGDYGIFHFRVKIPRT